MPKINIGTHPANEGPVRVIVQEHYGPGAHDWRQLEAHNVDPDGTKELSFGHGQPSGRMGGTGRRRIVIEQSGPPPMGMGVVEPEANRPAAEMPALIAGALANRDPGMTQRTNELIAAGQDTRANPTERERLAVEARARADDPAQVDRRTADGRAPLIDPETGALIPEANRVTEGNAIGGAAGVAQRGPLAPGVTVSALDAAAEARRQEALRREADAQNQERRDG